MQEKDEFCQVQRFNDIHTHTPGKPGSVLSITADEVEQIVISNNAGKTSQYYSLQLHPWHLTGDQEIEHFLDRAHQLRQDPYFVAIGECGLDSLCTTPLPLQLKAFRTALQIADQLQKPVIIHCVRLWAEMMAETKGHKTQLIIHGFRKGPALARQLLDAGFSLSLGKHYNKEVLDMIPQERLFYETDE